ncbi:MAG: M28 family metallopeptidase [Rhodanobacteraceae bacterium]
MRRIIPCTLIVATCFAACAQAANTPPVSVGDSATEAAPFTSAITAAGFRAYDKAISSDTMEGRKPGTVGAQRATAYIVDQFKKLGLQPGNHGSWFQQVPTVASTVQHKDTLKLDVKEDGGSQSFAYGTDMVVYDPQDKPHVAIKDSDIVYLGYGIDAPEYQWNDYANQDVKGKTVVVLVNDPGYATNDPELFKGRTMTYYGRWTYKYEQCARMGAAACLIVHDTGAAGYPWKVVKNSWTGQQLSLPASEDPAPRVPVAGWLTTGAARRLFAKAGLDFDKLKIEASKSGFKPVPLNATASIAVDSAIEHGSANNVLGLIKGSKYPDQVIVYSAHWDHFGRDPKLKGDQIFNGAIDNGTGISALLEIAGAFAKQKPKRSVLFLADTLEESGLLGSLYYTQHPVFPLDKTVADINMDAMDVIGPTRNMQIIGSGQSQLEDMLKAVLKTQGRYASPEATPENGFYFRSDHFSFAKAGVPAMDTLTGDDEVAGGTAAGRAALADYTAHRYHTVNDNFDPNWDFSGVAQDTQALYEVGNELANSEQWPQWKPGSEFRAKREAMMTRK